MVFVSGAVALAFLAAFIPSALEQGFSEFASPAQRKGSTGTAGGTNNSSTSSSQAAQGTESSQNSQNSQDDAVPLASLALEMLQVKGRAPKTGYERSQFGDGWAVTNGCTTREIILHRDLTGVVIKDVCTIESGTLQDPYTGKTIQFTHANSAVVQIDHVVALSNAWQTGAQQLTPDVREQLANDPLELLAVDGPANQAKGDADAATWLPKNKLFRCPYIARQITVKQKYHLWVTEAEKQAMRSVLDTCPEQRITTP